MAGKVNLIDPNNANLNYVQVGKEREYQENGIPQYQDMYIVAELTAVQRGRTILSTDVATDITKQDIRGFEKDKYVSFMGQNQDRDNEAHFNQFTTNWYDGSTQTDKTYEGFGINSIDVEINSSYIPQINIEFVDIRGLAFFNRENSPYRILFDFPPPIFYLSFKGYYGKGLTYQMHLVRYNTEFKAETGNYHITAKFIAITYAPLTDIPFRYILQAPLMLENVKSLTPQSTDPPENTLDLILKMQQVYSETNEAVKNDADNLTYENAQKKLTDYDTSLDVLFNYKNETYLTEFGTPIIFVNNISPNENNQHEIKTLKTYAEYNEYLKSFQTRDIPRNVDQQLYVGYFVDKDIKVPEGSTLDIEVNKRNEIYISALNKYKEHLSAKGKSIIAGITTNDIPEAKYVWDNTEGNLIDETKHIRYVGINITNYYIKLYKGKIKLEDEKLLAMNRLNTKINNMIEKKLGMLPTIYNIFEILLNDVDTFFSILKSTTIDAEAHHETFKTQIVNDSSYKDVIEPTPANTKMYSFPLVVQQEKVCNQIVEERKAPIELSKKCDEPFPELDMVQRFIDSFIKYNRIYHQATLRDERDALGNDKWIPFTPADSNLITTNLHSPYFGTDGGEGVQPMNLVEETRLIQVFRILMERYYLLSQNSLAYSFSNILSERNRWGEYLYDVDAQGVAGKAYRKLYSEAEAINLANSIINEDYASLLRVFSSNNDDERKLSSTTNGFYAYLEKNLPELYTGTPDSYEFGNGESLWRDKENSDYVGVQIRPMNDIVERTGTATDDFGVFISSTKSTIWTQIFKGAPDVIEDSFGFTSENLILRKDTAAQLDSSHKTKFLADKINHNPRWVSKIDNPDNVIGSLVFTKPIGYAPTTSYGGVAQTQDDGDMNRPFPRILSRLADEGNKYFFDDGFYYANMFGSEDGASIIDIWSRSLAECDTDIYNTVINYETAENNDFDIELSQLMYLSSFGRALSPFNYYPNYLNKDYFSTPSVVETPAFIPAYVGFLVGIQKGDQLWNKIYDFFTEGAGKNIESGGALIFADIHDVNTYLSANDKAVFRGAYDSWARNHYYTLASNVKVLYENADTQECDTEFEKQLDGAKINSSKYIQARNQIVTCKTKKYDELLNSNDHMPLFDPLIDRIGLICYNEITFRYERTVDPTSYTSLESILADTTQKPYVDEFFGNFFGQLKTKIEKRKQELIDEAKEFRESTGDEDIVTQTYYSFKNINDKWLAGLNKDIRGYPFKTNKDKGLISQFAFVDRAMNPIGDTIIDIQNLIDAKDSPDLSIFSVISQMLSLNGFEFFPLQNFMSFEENEWEEAFKIDTGGIIKQHPVFVCMFIGGASSYPTGLEKYTQFKDDGITDLNNPDVGDFLNEGCVPDPERDRQIDEYDGAGRPVSPEKGNLYSAVRAFRVRYGEQNQNMFYNFAVDSKEYPETNESIQILARLAGDEGKNAPVPKAQSLYNLYENRAYKATIVGFGNAMIQPTQYFQLENVPLFNGAYIILNVKHNITPNKMITTFSGTKLLKYPMPRVLNPAALVGFEGGSSDASSLTFEEVTEGVGTAGNPDQARYNSMYTLEIY